MKEYFKDNLHTINTEERNISPDPKFIILRLGLKNYYETFKPFNAKSKFYYFEGQNSEKLDIVIDHEYIATSHSSIMFIHQFFEQYISQILFDVNPILLHGKFGKDLDLVNALANDLSEIPTSANSVGYSIQLERIMSLIERFSEFSTEFKVPTKYHFLQNHREALTELSHQRNEIIHAGDKILAKYAYELLMIKYIIPLIRAVLKNEKKMSYLDRNTACEVNVLCELSKMKLHENYLANLDLAQKNLKKINHLKELSRASYENPLGMFEDFKSEDLPNIEKFHNAPIRKQSIDDALLRIYSGKAYKNHTCPCCGTDTLVTFEKWQYARNNDTWVEKARCLLCTYSINRSIGEPSEFGIKCAILFERVG